MTNPVQSRTFLSLRVGIWPTLLALTFAAGLPVARALSTNIFVNFETAPVHPLDLDPSGTRLAVANLPDARIEIFDVSGLIPRPVLSVPVGLDPVSVRWRTAGELWVVAQIADAVDIIEIPSGRIIGQMSTGDAPADVVFAGNPERAFVSSAGNDRLEVFDPVTRERTFAIDLLGHRPKALAITANGLEICVAISESGNATTILAPFTDQVGHRQGGGVADLPFGPNLGQNPAPNAPGSNTGFLPPLNPGLTHLPPSVPLIVRKGKDARWRDGEGKDWSEFVSGTNAAFSGRLPGWDLPDHDVALVNTDTLAVRYANGLMNQCSALAVNPVSGVLAVVGMDARNEVRFEPRLNGVFVQARLAFVNPTTPTILASPTLLDLNPHLTYTVSNLPPAQRANSVSDPRAALWNSDGSRLYVAGQGSANVAVFDSAGHRVGLPIALGDFAGPAGLALDGLRHRLFVLNRFSAELAQVDLANGQVTARARLADPTPAIIQRGRRVFYDAQLFSGLGQAACASCHIDGRFDRLAWDLGKPDGTSTDVASHTGTPTGAKTILTLHPMKGPMVTQTLQDILGHEPFHWRGDRTGIEDFGPTFTNLQSADRVPTPIEFEDFKGFLASLTFPPNPYRNFDNSLPTQVVLTGQTAAGRGGLLAGQPLPHGNAVRGLQKFRDASGADCSSCHTLPTGLGPNAEFNGSWQNLGRDTNGHTHLALLHLNRADLLPFKVSALRSVGEKLGFDLHSAESTAGFGLLHDGSIDTLPRFLHDGFRVSADQDQADLIAFLLAFTGSDLPAGSPSDRDHPPGVTSRDVPAGTGRQGVVDSANGSDAFNQFLALARKPGSHLELIVQRRGEGWWYDVIHDQFLGNTTGLKLTPIQLLAQARADAPLLAQLALERTGFVRALDHDGDGFRDGDELASGSDPDNGIDTPLTRNAAPVLTLHAPNTNPANLGELLWHALPGVQYQIQARSPLDSTWTLLGTVTGDRFSDSVSGNIEFPSGRFYRLLGEVAPPLGLPNIPASVVPPRGSVSPASLAVPTMSQNLIGQFGPSRFGPLTRSSAFPAGVLVATNFHRLTFQNLDLQMAVLPGLDFSLGSAINARFDGAQLRGASFFAGKFGGANFTGSLLDAADLREADFAGGQFAGAQMRMVRGFQVVLKSAIMTNADLRVADFGDADLSLADLRRSDLRGASFDHANLDLTDLRQTRRDGVTHFDPKASLIWHLANEGGAGENLRGADLSFAILTGADLHGAIFGNANLSGSELVGCDLRGCVLAQAQLEGTLLHFTKVDASTVFSAKFRLVWAIVNDFAAQVNLRGISLDGAWILFSTIDGIDFTGSTLRRCSLTEVSAMGADFTNVQFTSGFALDANFRRATFSGANLSDTDFSRANLSQASLRGANLTRVTFRGGNLTGADLTGAIFNQTTMPDGTIRNR